MRVTKTAILLSVCAAVTLFSVPTASAQIIELGKFGDELTPACPQTPCNAVTRLTGFQTSDAATKQLFVAPRAGLVVGFTLRLAKPNRTQIREFDKAYGGEAQAKISVLREVKPSKKTRKKPKHPSYLVTGESESIPLAKHFGKTVQFPLARSLTARKGAIVALTVPTWAPVLALGQPQTSDWIASREPKKCEDFAADRAQKRKATAEYGCTYSTGRLTYSATLISLP